MSAVFDDLQTRTQAVDAFLRRRLGRMRGGPADLRAASRAYFDRPAKRLRPCLVMLAAGACGGSEEAVLPAAAAVEIFHTWTLVHDDVIDADAVRRGGPSVHELGKAAALETLTGSPRAAARYGRDLALLAGDALQARAFAVLLECADDPRLDRDVVLDRINAFATQLTPAVMQGELLDVRLSLVPVETVRRAEIVRMMRLKTAFLFRFCAELGAALAVGAPPDASPAARALGVFAEKCGLAFQLHDDILGVTGDPKRLGKPVGSDLREKKRTLVVLLTLARAGGVQRHWLVRLLDHEEQPSAADVRRAAGIVRASGAIEAAGRLARQYVRQGLRALEALPPSPQKDTLARIASFTVERGF